MKKLAGFRRNNEYGFTLIELIVTIIILGIMAVTVAPKFLTSKGFAEYSYRDELIVKLRAIQLRTMQQTNDVACQKIQVNNSVIGLLATEENKTTCKANDFAGDSTKVSITDDNISFSISENLPEFYFSSLGRPVGCVAKTPCEITLTVTGDETLNVLINSEGYIYVP